MPDSQVVRSGLGHDTQGFGRLGSPARGTLDPLCVSLPRRALETDVAANSAVAVVVADLTLDVDDLVIGVVVLGVLASLFLSLVSVGAAKEEQESERGDERLTLEHKSSFLPQS